MNIKIQEFIDNTKEKYKKFKENRRYIVIERNGEVFETKRDIFLRDDRVITIKEIIKIIITKRGRIYEKNIRFLSNDGTYTIIYLDEIKYMNATLVGEVIL